MKTTGNILLTFIILILFGCTGEPGDTYIPSGFETSGSMKIEIIAEEGQEADKMETVRFFVFKEPDTAPELEVNHYVQLPPASGTNQQISKFAITLDVKKAVNHQKDKLVIVIVNEPPTMTNNLNTINTYNQLMDMQLHFDDFLNTTHTGFLEGSTMPMVAVSLTNKIYETEAEAKNDPVKMTLVRVTPRIDIYLRKEEGLDFNLAVGTTVTLKNTYDKEYFIHYENESDIFGKIQTITSGFLYKKYILAEEDNKDLPIISGDTKGRLLCSFHTPERTCVAAANSDKAILDIVLITSEGSIRSAEIIINKLSLEGTTKDIEKLVRNNIYQLIITVGANSIEAMVLDWNNEELPTEL